jgi:S-adenosylmethionine:tRNA ribosyltransferase-isomerase
MSVSLRDFDYTLPKELIAYHPAKKRDHSRLLVVDRKTGDLQHKIFHEIIEYLDEGDGLVINQTRVFPARVFGTNRENSRKIEVFFLKKLNDGFWEVLLRPSKTISPGAVINFEEDGLSCEITGRTESGSWEARVDYEGDFFAVLERIGKVPLPPYIKREAEENDRTTYQTVYAKETGAVAAPTAGLHFTDELLEKVEDNGVFRIPITLHVGWDSFRPVRKDDPRDHVLASEYFEIDETAAQKMIAVKKSGRKLVAVGTTTVRALETAADKMDRDSLKPQSGWTKKFIYPPYRFRMVDSLITNFHLPRSTLLLLVSAFATRELILEAYREAIRERYRFYSYGDAMFII